MHADLTVIDYAILNTFCSASEVGLYFVHDRYNDAEPDQLSRFAIHFALTFILLPDRY